MFCYILICSNCCIMSYVAAKKKKKKNLVQMLLSFVSSLFVGHGGEKLHFLDVGEVHS